MKTIYLVRHAEAIPTNKNVTDILRPLTWDGSRCARRAAERLRKSVEAPQVFVSSSAIRASETAEVFAKTFKFEGRLIRYNRKLYDDQSAQSQLAFFKKLSTKVDSVIVFGHNPGLTDFAKWAVPSFADSISKSGVVGLAFAGSSWSSVRKGRGKVVYLHNPETTKRRPPYSTIQLGMEGVALTKLHEAVREIEPELLAKLAPYLRKCASAIAKRLIKHGVKNRPADLSRAPSSSLRPPLKRVERTASKKRSGR